MVTWLQLMYRCLNWLEVMNKWLHKMDMMHISFQPIDTIMNKLHKEKE